MKYNKQSGQMLLSVILISTVLVTIGLAILQTTHQETKTTKYEEEQQKALAAAEAGIDAAIKLSAGSTITIESLNLDNTVSGTAVVDNTQSNIFTSPLLNKDSQITFFLGTYDPDTNNFSDEFNSLFTLEILSPTDYCGTDNQFGLELTFLHQTNGVIARRIIDKCNPSTITGTTDKLDSASDPVYSITPPAASHLLLIRAVALSNNFSGTKLRLTTTSGNWPLQGKTVISTAVTNTGVTKRIRFFQSYPQIPAEMMVTSF